MGNPAPNPNSNSIVMPTAFRSCQLTVETNSATDSAKNSVFSSTRVSRARSPSVTPPISTGIASTGSNESRP